jgi:hypothetical protein
MFLTLEVKKKQKEKAIGNEKKEKIKMERKKNLKEDSTRHFFCFDPSLLA